MILYLGNNLRSETVTQTTMVLLSDLLKKEGYKVQIGSSQRLQLFRLFHMLWLVLKYRKKADYVLIDTYSTRNFYYAVTTGALCRVLKLKYIPILHGGNLPERLKTSTGFSNNLFHGSYKNIAPSKYLKAEFEERGYQVEYIPNVLEIEKYKFKERGISMPKLLYVRAFASIYNPELAIRVFNEVKKKYPEASLCMIGPAKDASFESCKALVKTLELEAYVEFTGMLSKSEWHKKAEDFNIFLNTTNVDNTPVSILEAMALGLPVISTNAGGLAYLINDRETGILVPKDNVDQMVRAIDELCKDKELVSSIVKNARSKVEHFDWQYVKQQWHKILQ